MASHIEKNLFDLCKDPGEIGEFPRDITKIVGFGLGNCLDSEDFDRTSEYPASLTLQQLLKRHTGNDVALYAPDPGYTKETKEKRRLRKKESRSSRDAGSEDP